MFVIGFVLKHFSGRGTIILMVQNSEINRFQVLMDIVQSSIHSVKVIMPHPTLTESPPERKLHCGVCLHSVADRLGKVWQHKGQFFPDIASTLIRLI